MSPDSRGSGHRDRSRRLALAAGTACLLVAGLIASLSLTTALAGPSVQPRTTPPATTLAVIKVIGVGATPYSVAVDSADDTVYVANAAGNSLSVIDGGTASVTRTIGGASNPTGVAVNQVDDTVYVANRGANTVSVINGRNLDDSRLIFGGADPFRIAVNQVDDTIYVANFNANMVSVINGRNLDDSRAISLASTPTGIAVNQVDDTVYVTSSFPANSVFVINGRNPDDTGTVGVGLGPNGIAVDQTDDTVYVANDGDGTVSVIDGRAATVVGQPISVGINPGGLAVDQTDDTVYVTNLGDNTVSVINGRTATVWTTLIVDDGPFGVAVDDTDTNQGLVYVTSVGSNALSVIGRVEPSLVTTSGNSGSPVTIDVRVPQVLYDVDDATVASVSFGGTAVTPTALAGDAWQVTAPAGTPGTTVAVPVTVTFRGGLTASAGSFTLTTPAPTPTPTQPPQPLPPGAPAPVIAQAGDRSAEVIWGAPGFSGSGPVTEYEAQAFPAGNICRTTPPTTSCKVTGLSNGSGYVFRARAKNYVGWSAWSEYSNMVTPKGAVSIVISGSRDTKKPKIIKVSGATTGLTGSVTPWLKLGSGAFKVEPPVRLTSSGTFTWSAKTSAAARVYVTQGSVKSNTVTIRAR